MKFKIKAALAAILLLCSVNFVWANGVSPYLPLKVDPLIELELERLVSISKMPALSKPYHIVTITKYLEKIRSSHPKLYSRLTNYIKRYKKQYGLTQVRVEFATSDHSAKTLANQRGIKFDDNLRSTISGFYQFNKYFIANGGGSIIDGSDIIPHQSFLSIGYEYLQLDIGYKEHWLSPMNESAALISTNAKPIPSLSISNVKPITDWNIKYDLSFGLLDKMTGIHFDNKLYSGKPGFLTMQLSFQPINWWTVAGNRTFMFGGGQRSVTAGDVWKAIVDPISNDNCGGESELQDCNLEVGNQIASISSKFDLNIFDFPFSVYYEYAGEDAKDYQYSLGNIGRTLGIFIPYISENISAYIEHANFHERWYIHHLYDQGYRNDNQVMGHWWGDNKQLKDKTGAQVFTMRVNWDINTSYHLETKLSSIKNELSNIATYKQANELALSLHQVRNSGFINYALTIGKDVYGDSYYRLAVGYSW